MLRFLRTNRGFRATALRFSPVFLVLTCAAMVTGNGFAAPEQEDEPVAAAGTGVCIRSRLPERVEGPRPLDVGLTRADFAAIQDTVPVIQEAVPVRRMPAEARHLESEIEIELVGTIPRAGALFEVKVERGRFLTEADARTQQNVAVITEPTARELFGEQSAIGENVRVGSHFFLVVGELARPIGSPEDAPQIVIPLTTMRTRFGDTVVRSRSGRQEAMTYELSEIWLVAHDQASTDLLADVVTRLLERLHEDSDFEISIWP